MGGYFGRVVEYNWGTVRLICGEVGCIDVVEVLESDCFI